MRPQTPPIRESRSSLPALGRRVLAGLIFIFAFDFCTGAVRAAARPNIIIILLDDSGFSDFGCYGGEVQTPNIDRLGTRGLRYTQFYNTARCSPTRASLLTGLYSWQAGIGHLVEDWGQPGYTPALNRKCVTMAEALKSAGYKSYIAGKWHIGGVATNQFPCQRGFDRYFGTLVPGGGSFPGGGGNNWWLDNTYITITNAPFAPESIMFNADLFTDYAMLFLQEHLAATPDTPFFLYLPHTEPHWELNAPAENVARYRNIYTNGWEHHRQHRFAQQQTLGIVATNWALSVPEHSYVWTNLPVSEQATQDLAMATHSAEVDRVDWNVGRLVSFLQANNLYTNTIIFVLSDNGASNEGGNNGLATSLRLSTVGANWSNTPFRRYKKWVCEGGIATPLIAHWPAGITQAGLRWQPGHVIDLMPTCLELAGAAYPSNFHGNPVIPLEGRSLVSTFTNETVTPRVLFFEHEGNRAVRSNDWKLVAIGRTGPFELYDLASDRTEQTNLASVYPQIVVSLSNTWETTAWRVQDYPSPDNNNSLKMRAWLTVDDATAGDGDGFPEPGEIVDLTAQIIKQGSGASTGLSGTLASFDPGVTFFTSTCAYGDFSGGKASNLSPFRLRLPTDAPVSGTVAFELTIHEGPTEQWRDQFSVVVRSGATVTGLVTEVGNNQQVPGAMVSGGMVASATTDGFGRYRLGLESGAYTLGALAQGYAPTQTVLAVSDSLVGRNLELVWTNDGLSMRLDRPASSFVVIPTNVNLLLKSTVHNGPYPGAGLFNVVWSLVSGPEAPEFENPDAEDAAVRFPQTGNYDLRVVANTVAQQTTQLLTVVVSDVGVVPPAPTNGLIVHLRLDETAGAGVAEDSSGYGHHGTLYDMDVNTAWTSGVHAGALQFDGADDVVGIATSANLNSQTTAQRTVSLWFRANAPGSSAKQVLYEEGGTTRGLNIYLSDGQLYAGGYNRDANQSGWNGNWVSLTGIKTQTWQHVALILNGGPTVGPDAVIGYLDGVEFGRAPGSQLWSRGDANGIGACYDATRFHDNTMVGQTNGAWFNGMIDDVRLYGRVLTLSEIRTLAGVYTTFTPHIAVDAGSNQPLHQGLAVPLTPSVSGDGMEPTNASYAWTAMQLPAGGSAAFSNPDSLGIDHLVNLGLPGGYVLRLWADSGEIASFDDVVIGAVHSYGEWITGFGSLAPDECLPEADPDMDFGANLLEYELGTAPDCGGCAGAGMKPVLQLRLGAQPRHEIEFPVRRGALERGLTLTVQHTTDLETPNWSVVPHTLASVADTPDYDFQKLTLHLDLSPEELAQEGHFFKLIYSLYQ